MTSMHDTSLTCSSNFQKSADQGLYESGMFFCILMQKIMLEMMQSLERAGFFKTHRISLTYRPIASTISQAVSNDLSSFFIKWSEYYPWLLCLHHKWLMKFHTMKRLDKSSMHAPWEE